MWVVYVRGELWVNGAGEPWAFDHVDIAQQIAEQVFGRRAGIRVVYVGGR